MDRSSAIYSSKTQITILEIYNKQMEMLIMNDCNYVIIIKEYVFSSVFLGIAGAEEHGVDAVEKENIVGVSHFIL